MDRNISGKHLTPARRLVQASAIAALIAVLLGRQIAVDLEAQGITFFGRVVWFHEVGMLLLALALPFALLAAFSTLTGRTFCGWLCPQTSLCELAGAAQRLVASSRSRGTFQFAFTLIGAIALGLAVSLGGGIALVSVLVPPETVSGIGRGEVNTSLLKGITITALLILVDIALLRHSFCEWLCVFGWWQRLFGTNRSLSVAGNRERMKECLKCNECRASCFMGIDPRRGAVPGSCLNCGLCVSACSAKMAAVGAETLISYRLGKAEYRGGSGAKLALARGLGAVGLLLVVGGMVAWVAVERETVQVRVRQEAAVELVDGQARGQYAVDVFNNAGSSFAVKLGQTGLPLEGVLVDPNPITVAPHRRATARFSFTVDLKELHPGRNEFWVNASAADDAGTSSYRVVFGLPLPASQSPASDRTAEAPDN